MREFVKNTKMAVIPKAKMKGARANLFAPILKTAARARKKRIRKILRIRFFRARAAVFRMGANRFARAPFIFAFGITAIFVFFTNSRIFAKKFLKRYCNYPYRIV